MSGAGGELVVSSRELGVLAWVGEMGAARVDQVARLLGRSERTGQRWAARMKQAGWIEARRVLGDEPAWVWLTSAGQRASGNGFHPWRLSVGKLAHIGAVNEVRLYVAARAPESEWVCERRLAQDRAHPREHLPDAVVHTGGQRHAIEVELTPKASRRMPPLLDDLSERFDAVLFFCPARTRRQLDTLAASGRWPKLAVRDLPAPPANERPGG